MGEIPRTHHLSHPHVVRLGVCQVLSRVTLVQFPGVSLPFLACPHRCPAQNLPRKWGCAIGGHKRQTPRAVNKTTRGAVKPDALTLASLEAWLLLVNDVHLAAATHYLGARLILQRPKRLADLHRALLSFRMDRNGLPAGYGHPQRPARRQVATRGIILPDTKGRTKTLGGVLPLQLMADILEGAPHCLRHHGAHKTERYQPQDTEHHKDRGGPHGIH